MESESGAKIAIRGKGSVKEGKGRSDAAHTSNQEEDLHCLIMADTEDKVNKAKKLIHNVIETVNSPRSRMTLLSLTNQAASIPEGQNELKRNQLRELAALNGTLRDDENQACQNCGEIGHRKYDCPSKPNFTASIICRVCGQAGHMARDCPQRKSGMGWRNDSRGGDRNQAQIGGGDDLDSFLNEMGGAGGRPAAAIEYGNGGGAGGAGDAGGAGFGEGERALKPWERGPTGGQAPWARNNREDPGDSNAAPAAAAPPWAGAGAQAAGSYNQGGYNNAPAAPWAAAGNAPYGHNYGGGYDQYAAPAAAAPGMGYGYGAAPAPPPGIAPAYGYGSAGSPPPPPPPPGSVPPPPPPSEQPPPVSVPYKLRTMTS